MSVIHNEFENRGANVGVYKVRRRRGRVTDIAAKRTFRRHWKGRVEDRLGGWTEGDGAFIHAKATFILVAGVRR
jgi:hypothetical protein